MVTKLMRWLLNCCFKHSHDPRSWLCQQWWNCRLPNYHDCLPSPATPSPRETMLLTELRINICFSNLSRNPSPCMDILCKLQPWDCSGCCNLDHQPICLNIKVHFRQKHSCFVCCWWKWFTLSYPLSSSHVCLGRGSWLSVWMLQHCCLWWSHPRCSSEAWTIPNIL